MLNRWAFASFRELNKCSLFDNYCQKSPGGVISYVYNVFLMMQMFSFHLSEQRACVLIPNPAGQDARRGKQAGETGSCKDQTCILGIHTSTSVKGKQQLIKNWVVSACRLFTLQPSRDPLLLACKTSKEEKVRTGVHTGYCVSTRVCMCESGQEVKCEVDGRVRLGQHYCHGLTWIVSRSVQSYCPFHFGSLWQHTHTCTCITATATML